MKKIIVIIVAVILIAAVTVAAFVIPKNTDSADNTLESAAAEEVVKNHEGIFGVSTISEMKKIAKKSGFDIDEHTENIYSLSGDSYLDLDIQFEFFADETDTDKIRMMNCYYIPFASEYAEQEKYVFTHSGAELKSELDKFLSMIEKEFNVVIDENYFIIGENMELLDHNDSASFDKIITEKAKVEFTLRDVNGNYWLLVNNTTDNGMVYFSFSNYYNSEIYADSIVHVTVQ